MKFLKFFLCFVISALLVGALCVSAQIIENEPIVLNFIDYQCGIVNGMNTATLTKTSVDGRSALKIVPRPENATTRYNTISVDGYAYQKAGIDLGEYQWVAFEYYYESDAPAELYMQADILTNGGAITKRTIVNSEIPVKANRWAIELFDFTVIEDFLTEGMEEHILRQMHFRPFGENNLNKLSKNDAIYISKVMFFAQKPELSYRNGFLEGYPDGTFKGGNVLTRAEACKMVASCLELDDGAIDGTSRFEDVGDEWYARYIGYLDERKLLGFANEKNFYPDKPITMSDFTKLAINSGIITEMGNTVLENDIGVIPENDYASKGTVTRLKAAMILNQLRGAVVSEENIPDSIFILYLDVERDNPYFAQIAEASFDHVSEGADWVYASQDPIESLVDKVGEELLYNTDEGDAIVEYYDGVELQRITEIRNTPNMSIPSSNVVYVSQSTGDDRNSGLSDDVPVKTIAKANTIAKQGWTVLLRRGDTWRETVKCVQGVTYTAYGAGEKPKIYGSPENGTGQNKWVLVHEDAKTGALIWKYHREDFLDVGTIIFNDGEGFAMKEVPSCVGADYYVRGQESLPVEERTPFDYTVELDKNLEFFHAANSEVTKNSTIGDYINISTSTGPLYLRCDNGNPGKVFHSIEFNTRPSAISATHDVTIDNLCIMYAGVHGISCGTVRNLRVTNCEIGWIGGSIQGYTANGNTKRSATRLGNGVEVYGGCDGYTIDNCYVYQCYDAGVTHQFSNLSAGNCIMNNVTYSNNVITECVYSIEYFLGTYGEDDQYIRQGDNILFDSNLMRRAGFGFGSFRPDGHNQRHIRSSDRNNPFTNYRIVNNVFDRSVHQLIAAITDREEWKPSFDGNIFIQGINNGFYSFAYYGSAKTDFNATELMRRILGDKNGKFYFVKNIPYWKYDYTPSKSYPVTDSDRK